MNTPPMEGLAGGSEVLDMDMELDQPAVGTRQFRSCPPGLQRVDDDMDGDILIRGRHVASADMTDLRHHFDATRYQACCRQWRFEAPQQGLHCTMVRLMLQLD